MRIASLLVLLVVLGAAGWYFNERTRTCVVGVTGTEATVTVTGFRASRACDDLIRSQREAYRRETPPDGGVLCEFDRDRRRYVVRDKGTFVLIGRALCASLQRDSLPR